VVIVDDELRALVADEGVVLWGQVVNLHRALNARLHAHIREASGLDGMFIAARNDGTLILARNPAPEQSTFVLTSATFAMAACFSVGSFSLPIVLLASFCSLR